MKNQYQKLLRVAMGTVFCLVCMFTKHTAASIGGKKDPALLEHLTKQLQQVQLQIKSMDKELQKLQGQEPLTRLYKLIKKNQIQKRKQKTKNRNVLRQLNRQQRERMDYTTLKFNLASAKLKLQYTKKLQQNMDAQQLDAPLGNIFDQLAQQYIQKRIELKMNQLLEQQTLERRHLQKHQQLAQQFSIDSNQTEQQMSQQYVQTKKDIIQQLDTINKKKMYYEQLQQELRLIERRDELQLKKLNLQIKLIQ